MDVRVDDNSISTIKTNIKMDRIIAACNSNRKSFTFTAYDKEWKHEHSRNGNGIRSFIIDLESFDRDPEQVKQEILKIRQTLSLKNRNYKLHRECNPEYMSPEYEILNLTPDQLMEKYRDIVKSKQQSNIELFDDGLPRTVLLVGRGKAGKTTMAMYLYDKYYAKNSWISILFAGNPQIKAYDDHKYLLVRDSSEGIGNPDQDIIKTSKWINANTNNKYNFLYLFDDCLHMRHSKLLDNMILSYRNANLSTIVSLQYLYMISKQNRNNVNCIFFFKFDDKTHLCEIIKAFLADSFREILGKNATMDEMMTLYEAATEDHGCIFWCPFEKYDKVKFVKLKL
jgi:hypothetical protein